MAYDLPAETDPRHLVPVGRGPSALFRKPTKRAIRDHLSQFVRLDPDVRDFFRDDVIVNQALRKAMELALMHGDPRRKKTG